MARRKIDPTKIGCWQQWARGWSYYTGFGTKGKPEVICVSFVRGRWRAKMREIELVDDNPERLKRQILRVWRERLLLAIGDVDVTLGTWT